MPARTASVLTFFYAMGYPIGALAVSAMSPMAVLVFRFGLAGGILSAWVVAGARELANGPHAGSRAGERTARPGAAVHLPLRGAAPRCPRGVGSSDHLDEPGGHDGARGDVPQRAAHVGPGRRAHARRGRRACGVRRQADHRRRCGCRGAAAGGGPSGGRRRRRLPAEVLRRRRLPGDGCPAKRRVPPTGGSAAVRDAVVSDRSVEGGRAQ